MQSLLDRVKALLGETPDTNTGDRVDDRSKDTIDDKTVGGSPADDMDDSDDSDDADNLNSGADESKKEGCCGNCKEGDCDCDKGSCTCE